MAKKLSKKELINVLVEQYGYELEDIKMLTNAKLEGMIKQEEADREELEHQETAVIIKDAGFKDDDMILVMSGVAGALKHRSLTTSRVWDFLEFGQTQKMPYSELLTIRNTNPKVFNQGWLVVLNKRIQEDFGLIEMYKNILTPETMETVFDKSVDELSVLIDNLPEGMQLALMDKARTLYNNGKIDSISIVKLIEQKFNISLEDNAPLSDIAVKAKKKE